MPGPDNAKLHCIAEHLIIFKLIQSTYIHIGSNSLFILWLGKVPGYFSAPFVTLLKTELLEAMGAFACT